MPMLRIPTSSLERLATAEALHEQALKNRGQSSLDFSVAVLEVVRAKCEIAEHALAEWKAYEKAYGKAFEGENE